MPLTGVKPGYKTTELLVIALVIVGQVLSALADWIQPGAAARYSTYAAVGYAVARGLAKMHPPKDETTTTPRP
jgi:hypothetical protein